MSEITAASKYRSWGPRRRGLFLALYGALVVAGLLLGRQFMDFADVPAYSVGEVYLRRIVVTAILIYVVAAALPFVPAAEIGLALMLVVGPQTAAPVYAATVFALTLAFLIGRAVPASACAAAFGLLGFTRARELVLETAALDAEARLKFLLAHAPARVVPRLLRHRYLVLALAFNLPGNSLMGGGGGIALSAGMSGLYPIPAYLATLAAAVAPVPLVIALSSLLQ